MSEYDFMGGFGGFGSFDALSGGGGVMGGGFDMGMGGGDFSLSDPTITSTAFGVDGEMPRQPVPQTQPSSRSWVKDVFGTLFVGMAGGASAPDPLTAVAAGYQAQMAKREQERQQIIEARKLAMAEKVQEAQYLKAISEKMALDKETSLADEKLKMSLRAQDIQLLQIFGSPENFLGTIPNTPEAQKEFFDAHTATGPVRFIPLSDGERMFALKGEAVAPPGSKFKMLDGTEIDMGGVSLLNWIGTAMKNQSDWVQRQNSIDSNAAQLQATTIDANARIKASENSNRGGDEFKLTPQQQLIKAAYTQVMQALNGPDAAFMSDEEKAQKQAEAAALERRFNEAGAGGAAPSTGGPVLQGNSVKMPNGMLLEIGKFIAPGGANKGRVLKGLDERGQLIWEDPAPSSKGPGTGALIKEMAGFAGEMVDTATGGVISGVANNLMEGASGGPFDLPPEQRQALMESQGQSTNPAVPMSPIDKQIADEFWMLLVEQEKSEEEVLAILSQKYGPEAVQRVLP